MILKSPLTKLFKPWIWSTGLILIFGASAWGIEEGLIAPRIREAGHWNLEAKRLERRVSALLPQFPDLEALRLSLKKQQGELDRLQNEAAALDKKVLRTSALNRLLEKKGEARGKWKVNPIESGGDSCQIKPYICGTFEVEGEREFGSLIQYLDSLESSSPFVEILELEAAAGGPGGLDRPKVKIRVKATHLPDQRGN